MSINFDHRQHRIHTSTGTLKFDDTGSIVLPVGTTAQRPTAAEGQVRFNETTNQYEAYDGTQWVTFSTIEDGNLSKDEYVSNQINLYTGTTTSEVRLNIDASGNLSFGTNLTEFTINQTTGDTTIAGTLSVGTLDHSSDVIEMDMTGALVLPVGTVAERPSTPEQGMIRYNSDDTTFEGYDGTAWGSLGGVKDVDQDTYISAEDSAGNDNDELDFFTAGQRRVVIKNDGKVGIGTDSPAYTLDVTGTIRATGNIIAQGDITLGAGGDGDTIVVDATVSSDLVPTTDDTYDLGSSTAQMAEVYTGQIKTSAGDLTINPTGNIDVSSNRITNLASPTATTDATTKAYVDSAISGGGGSVQIGTPTDGAYFKTPGVDSYTGTRDGAATALVSSTMVGDAVDILNEAMLNVYRNTYVRDVSATVSNATPPALQNITFTVSWYGNPDTVEIDYGDGNTDTDTTLTTGSDNTGSTTFTHNYANGGNFTVTVDATNTDGTGNNATAQRIYTNMVTVATATPVVDFKLWSASTGGTDVTSSGVDEGSTVYLENLTTNTGAAAGLSNTVEYTIDWGDGNTDTVSSDSDAGGRDGARLSHTYSTVTGDTTFTVDVEVTAHGSAASDDIPTNTSKTFKVYEDSISPSFSADVTSGNNEEATNGLVVTFTNNTTGSPGSRSTFGNQQTYVWDWDDGTSNTVNIGSGASGDTNQTITHTFDLSNRAVGETFDVTLTCNTGNSSSPFVSSATTITVNPDPRANVSVVFTNEATGISGASDTRGYAFVGYDGNNYAEVTGTNTSENATSYTWTWGDGETDTVTTTASQTHDYTSDGTGTYNGSLLAYHSTYSTNASDDTENFSVQILPTPSAPQGLNSKTLTFTGEDTGTSPKLAHGATDHVSGGATVSSGDDVNRTTDTSGTIQSDILSTYAYNAASGTLTAMVNGSADGAITFTSSNNAGTNLSLVVTEDIDANAVNSSGQSSSGSTYPNNFYRVFKARISKTASAVSDGINSYQLQHSTNGNTNVLEFVKDDLTATPTIDVSSVTMTESSAGTKRYISGVEYYNSGGAIQIAGATIDNFIGQTYRDTSTVLTFVHASNDEGTSGNLINTQNKSYSDIDGATTFLTSGIPNADTGNGTAYTMGNLTVNINGSARAVGQIRMRGNNVNGSGSYVTLPTKIQLYSQSLSGFDEGDITVSGLGSGFTDNAKRVVMSTLSGATPAYTSTTNYYTGDAWSGSQTVAGTDNAIVRFGELKHFDTDLSSGYLPAGPDLATGRSGTQYFRGAFRRTLVANFSVTITGKISGFKIAAPGTDIDDASGLGGWLDATVPYAGSGVPGSDTANGGNGSNGCAKTSGDTITTGSVISNQTFDLTLGSENLSNATGNQLLFSIELADGDYVSSISFGSA